MPASLLALAFQLVMFRVITYLHCQLGSNSGHLTKGQPVLSQLTTLQVDCYRRLASGQGQLFLVVPCEANNIILQPENLSENLSF